MVSIKDQLDSLIEKHKTNGITLRASIRCKKYKTYYNILVIDQPLKVSEITTEQLCEAAKVFNKVEALARTTSVEFKCYMLWIIVGLLAQNIQSDTPVVGHAELYDTHTEALVFSVLDEFSPSLLDYNTKKIRSFGSYTNTSVKGFDGYYLINPSLARQERSDISIFLDLFNWFSLAAPSNNDSKYVVSGEIPLNNSRSAMATKSSIHSNVPGMTLI